eukprot:symbB.v1.2.034771.t1/scaffold4545.1/size38247/4
MIRNYFRCAKIHVAKLRTALGIRTCSSLDPYKILGVRQGASQEEVRAAYLKAAFLTHPDSKDSAAGTTEVHDAEEAFRRVSEAYQRLRSRGKGKPSNSRVVASHDGRPPFSSVSNEQAEKLFQAAFSGRGVDEMLDEELARFNIKPGVHATAVKEGIYARLLRAALAASQLAPAQDQAEGFSRNLGCDHWPRLEVQRETLHGDDGIRRLRIRTITRWPNGRKEEHIVEKPVYRL